MAGRRKRARILAALRARARREISPEATALRYVCFWLLAEETLAHLAKSLEVELGESVSRSFLSMLVHRLAPGAGECISAARRGDRDGAVAALTRIESPRASVAGAPEPQSPSASGLHMDALRVRVVHSEAHTNRQVAGTVT